MRVEIVTFTASILINVALLGSFEKANQRYEMALEQQKKVQEIEEELGGLAFEFVEAPKKALPQRPAKTKKISDRDAVAQNPEPAKASSDSTTPHIPNVGPSDQLAQQQVSPSQPPVAPSKPSPEVRPMPEAQEQPKPTPDAEMAKTVTPKPVDEMDAIRNPSQFSPEQKPVAPVVGLTGADRITTKAVSRNASHGVQVLGETSFEAMGSDMGFYFKNMKERIWLAWFPYLSIHYPKDFRTADVLVRFYLSPDGQVLRIETLSFKGSPLFAAFCMEAVKRAAPFGPVPPDVLELLGKDELEVKFGFHFW